MHLKYSPASAGLRLLELLLQHPRRGWALSAVEQHVRARAALVVDVVRACGVLQLALEHGQHALVIELKPAPRRGVLYVYVSRVSRVCLPCVSRVSRVWMPCGCRVDDVWMRCNVGAVQTGLGPLGRLTCMSA